MSENLNTSNVENNNPNNSSRILKHEKHLIEMRRARVLELWSQGWSQPRIADEVHVVQSTIHEDISFLKQQAREQLKNFVTSELPNTIARTKVSLDLVTAKLWATVAEAERDGDNKIKLQALSQINQVEAQKIEIVSNLGIVDSVVGAAEQRGQQDPYAEFGTRGTLPDEEEEPEENTNNIALSEFRQSDTEEPAPPTKARAIPLQPEDQE